MSDTRLIRGAEVKVGDGLMFAGRSHTVTAIEPYENPVEWAAHNIGPSRVAFSYDGWTMTIIDDGLVEVAA